MYCPPGFEDHALYSDSFGEVFIFIRFANAPRMRFFRILVEAKPF